MLLASLGVVGGTLILLRGATYGVGLGNDSTAYISTAQSLLEGNGFVQWNGGIYQDFPPFFPLLVAFAGILGIDAIAATGYVNAAAFGLTVFVATLWLRSHVESRFLVIWAGCACALSPLLADLSARALSEPLFILFITLSLFALDRFLDTGKRSSLLLAAICAAVVCLTRYVGVALVASALLMLTLQRGTTFPAKVRNATAYALVAMTPIGVWMLRNFLHSGLLKGKSYPSGFSLLGALHNLTDEFVKQTFGETGFAYLNIWSETIFDITITGAPTVAGVSLKVAVLLALTIGVGYARSGGRQGRLLNWSILAVPVVFVSVYALFLAISLPLTDIKLHRRYIAPVYVPVLVTATLILNEFLRSASEERPLGNATLLRKWNTGLMGTTRVPAFILMGGLSLWLSQQVSVNYNNIQYWRDNGWGYGSRQWANSEIIRYMRSLRFDGYILTNHTRPLYLLAAVRTSRRMPAKLDSVNREVVRAAHLEDKDMYVVWFYRGYPHLHLDYGLMELGAFPGLGVVAILQDGVILKAGKDYRPLDKRAILKAILKDFRSVIRSDFDVYHNENENRLAYAKDECSDADIGPRFFLHIDPVDHTDLPAHRQQYGFDNLDFSFDEFWSHVGGQCFVVRPLPDYEIDTIHTGQYRRVDGGFEQVWEGSFDLAGRG